MVSEVWTGLQRFMEHYPYPFDPGSETDIESSDASIIVADGYEFDLRPLERHEATTVVIDDVGQRDPAVDLVVNPNIYAPELNYRAAGRTLLGAEYALLRPEFVDARAQRLEARPTADRAFVMMGGADPTNETAGVLRALDLAGFSGAVDVVTARQDIEPDRHDFALEVHQSVQSPAALMRDADFAICAAGGSTWELACIGVPAIQVVVADNQALIGAWLRDQNSAIVLDSPIDPLAASAAVRQMADAATRDGYSRRARALVDGLGAMRVVETLQGHT